MNLQPAGSLRIVRFPPGMKAAVNFDEKLLLETCEIDDERTKWHLPSETAILNLATA